MPTNKTDIYYIAGKEAFTEGKDIADKPTQYLTMAWEYGWLDSLASEVRALKPK